MRPLWQKSAAEKKEVANQLRQILENDENIFFACIFGSFIEQTAFHDLDLGIYLTAYDREQTEDIFWKYEITLATRLESTLGWAVDVVVLNYASPALSFAASSGNLLFCRDEDFYYQWREQTWRQ
ncbi:MAG: nucleotidyltransferase domain-containing protein, partial [Bacillota bacterium]